MSSQLSEYEQFREKIRLRAKAQILKDKLMELEILEELDWEKLFNVY